MDAIVASPYGLLLEQKRRDLVYVQNLAEQLLTELVDALNEFHTTRHNRRYWQIVLGHWLQRYVAVTYNRYRTLEQALSSYAISSTVVIDWPDYSLATTDTLSFIWACNDDTWNHVLHAKILEFLGFDNVEVVSNVFDGTRSFVQQASANSARRGLKQIARDIASFGFRLFCKATDAFVINSYLPRIEELKLQLSLGQVPQLWKSPRPQSAWPEKNRRQALIIQRETANGFERFVRENICNVIPTCYLESYQELTYVAEKLPWPNKPQFIFTSNNFDSDEIFKIWTASKTEQGIPYFTGQHGNNYGTLCGSENWPEMVTCDKFLTWGWTNGNAKNIPAFVFKTAGRKAEPLMNARGLLLIEVCLPHRITPWDNYSEYEVYQEEQFRFVDKLPEAIRQQLTVRLHAEHRRHRWADVRRWADRFPSISIENGEMSIRKLIAENGLVVHSYDSTGILECLNLNIPMLCFWQGDLDHVLLTAKPYYELLRSAGIVCDSPEQAAERVACHWEDIASWWLQRSVQDARKAFCSQYARREEKPIKKLTQLLRAEASLLGRPQETPEGRRRKQ